MKIYLGTNTTDIADKTTTVIVGQKISLRCELSDTNLTITNYQWTVPGFAISNYVADENSGTVYSNFPTPNSNVTRLGQPVFLLKLSGADFFLVGGVQGAIPSCCFCFVGMLSSLGEVIRSVTHFAVLAIFNRFRVQFPENQVF